MLPPELVELMVRVYSSEAGNASEEMENHAEKKQSTSAVENYLGQVMGFTSFLGEHFIPCKADSQTI